MEEQGCQPPHLLAETMPLLPPCPQTRSGLCVAFGLAAAWPAWVAEAFNLLVRVLKLFQKEEVPRVGAVSPHIACTALCLLHDESFFGIEMLQQTECRMMSTEATLLWAGI